MSLEAWYGILIPFLGTALGSACVFLMKKAMGDRLQRALTGFAAGVMVAASIWSLLLPAMEGRLRPPRQISRIPVKNLTFPSGGPHVDCLHPPVPGRHPLHRHHR